MLLVFHGERLVLVYLDFLRLDVALFACTDKLCSWLFFGPSTDVDASATLRWKADDIDSAEEYGDTKQNKQEVCGRQHRELVEIYQAVHD